MKPEQIKEAKAEALEKQNTPNPNLEQPQEVLDVMVQAEAEIDKITDEVFDSEKEEEVTQRLIALGANSEDTESVVARIKKIDQLADEEKQGVLKNFYGFLGRIYTENLEHIDKSIVADIKMRPIYKKYIQSDRDRMKEHYRKEKIEKKNLHYTPPQEEIPSLWSANNIFFNC